MASRKPRAFALGVDDAEYERLLNAQDGHCAICPNTPKTRRLHVDHDHKTGAIRGLLCFRCNRFLHGWMTSRWLASALSYVLEAERRKATDLEYAGPILQDGKP